MRLSTSTLSLAITSLMGIGLSCILVACNSSSSSDTASAATPTPTNTTTPTTTDNSTTNTSSGTTTSTTSTASTTCTTQTTTATKLQCLAAAFETTLSSSELATVRVSLSSSNATSKWSNLPVTMVAREGLSLESLSSTSKAAAEALMNAALSSQGQTQMSNMRAADGYLATIQATDYGANKYYIAFLGTPSTTSPWMIQFTGHHYTTHIAVNGTTNLTSHTPMFVAVEPTSWTASGVSYEPLKQHHDSLLAMLNGLSSTQLATAKLSQAYDDLVVGPQKDGKFPSTASGLQVSMLSSAQQDLVKAAIAAYASNPADTAAYDAYTSSAALASTYISWASYSDLATKGSYVRIDGPRVWIEFSVQNGILIRNKVHFHSIWRDKQYDYGANFAF